MDDTPRTRVWKTLGSKKNEDLIEWVKANVKEGQVVHIGTDSLQGSRGGKRHTQFVTVLIVLTPSKGGRVIYTRELVPRIESLRQRLLAEVWRSLEVALSIQSLISGPLTVHVDANPKERYNSSKYLQELVGMVVGNGFAVAIKPDSWAATHAADFIVRHHGKIPGEKPPYPNGKPRTKVANRKRGT